MKFFFTVLAIILSIVQNIQNEAKSKTYLMKTAEYGHIEPIKNNYANRHSNYNGIKQMEYKRKEIPTLYRKYGNKLKNIENCQAEPSATQCKCRSRYESIPPITCSPFDLCTPNEGFDNNPKCRTLKKCTNSTFSGEKCFCGNTKMICKDDSRCDPLVLKCLPECKMFQQVTEVCICLGKKNEKCHSGDECLIYDNYLKKFDNNCAVPPMDRCSNICKSKGVIEGPANLTDLTEVWIIAEGNSEFGQKLYDSVRKEQREKNLVISPYSASSVMAMAALGARGVTLDEIMEGMEFPKKRDILVGFNNVFKVLRGNNNFTLDTANQLFVQEGFQLVKDFVNVMKEKFYSNLTQTNFADSEAARKLINDWVEHKTRGKIKNLFPKGVLDDSTRLVLVNAIYFKGVWEKTFAKKLTKDADFYVEEGRVVQVKMMRIIEGKFKMVDLNDINAKAIKIPYKGQRICMYIILPNNKFGLGDVETKLSETNLFQLFAKVYKAKTQTVDLFLPKFKLEKSIILTDHLKKLGMVQMFEDKADFSDISPNSRLSVSTVIQKASIEVNEEGSEAAAATGVVVGPPSIPEQFVCDHPFNFFIFDKLTHMVLFSGRLMDPTS